jgi:hypothetical protein
MDVDRELAKVIAYALTRGQGAFTEEEFIDAYQQVYSDQVAGTFAELLLEGQLALRVDDDGGVKYIGLELADKINSGGGKFADAEIAAAVEAFISSVRSPKGQAD